MYDAFNSWKGLVYAYYSLHLNTFTWGSQYALSTFRYVQKSNVGMGTHIKPLLYFNILGTCCIAYAHSVQLWARDGVPGYWISLLCENSIESIAGMLGQHLLISEYKTEEILSCQIREMVYGMPWFLIADFLALLLHYLDVSLACTQTVLVSLFSFFLSNYGNWFQYNKQMLNILGEGNSQGQLLTLQRKLLLAGHSPHYTYL